MAVRVAIDSSALTPGHDVRGIGHFLREFFKSLRAVDHKYKNLTLELTDFSKTDLSKYDVAHFPDFSPFFVTLPFVKRTKWIVTISDLIPLIYPNIYPPGIRGKIKFLIQKYNVRKADQIITIAETNKKDIVRFLGIPAKKINTVYLAPADFFKPIKHEKKLAHVAKKYNLPQKFVFYLGDVNYTKNVINLAKACKIASIPLVISGKHAKEIENIVSTKKISGIKDVFRSLAGKTHPEIKHYKELVKLFEDKNIIRLGFVPDEDLVAVFNLASVYCQVSFYEGFGLPAAQAMACGTPVVISKTQTLVEIFGDASLIAKPHDPRDIADKITELQRDKVTRDKLIKEGYKIAKKLTWEKNAEKTIEVYKKAASKR